MSERPTTNYPNPVVPERGPRKVPSWPAVIRMTLRKLLRAEPIPMRLTCPSCGELHIDEGEFAVKPHHTHACQSCGMVWRPAVEVTVGVRFLPGFKDLEGHRDDVAIEQRNEARRLVRRLWNAAGAGHRQIAAVRRDASEAMQKW